MLIALNRIFVVPTEPDVAIKAAEKAASASRSAIRRQRAVRRSQAPVSVENIRRRMQGIVTDSNSDRYEIWENAARDQRPSPRRADELSSASHARGARGLEEERMRLRDSISFERQHPPNVVIDGPLMPPAPEPRDYTTTEMRRRDIQHLLEVRRDLRRIARRRPAPTPPYTDTDLALMARMGTESPRASSGTPARSPRLTLGELETVTFGGRLAPETSSSTAPEPARLARSPSGRPRAQETEIQENQETSTADGARAPAGDTTEANVSPKDYGLYTYPIFFCSGDASHFVQIIESLLTEYLETGQSRHIGEISRPQPSLQPH